MKHQAITIVIVEDHALVRKGLANILKGYSFEILFTAEHGRHFFEQLDQNEKIPDVCIMDLNMPVMNGYVTIAKIREQDIPMRIIAFTMNDSEQCIQRALEVGADECIVKDVPPERLVEAIARVSKMHHVLE